MIESEPRRVTAAFKITCIGADPAINIQAVEATVTVNNDGMREVGCPYIGTAGQAKGTCSNLKGSEKITAQKINCVHLYPQVM
mgnify:CR=1 FL=1